MYVSQRHQRRVSSGNRSLVWMVILGVAFGQMLFFFQTSMSTKTATSGHLHQLRRPDELQPVNAPHTPRQPDDVIKTQTESKDIVGIAGGAWTAETHLQQYGFNVDAGLVRVLEASCREIENTRNAPDSQWSAHPSLDSPIGGYWRAPAVVDCKVLELGSGVGIYVDALKKDQAKKKRKVFGIEPNRMGGIYERRNGPRQLLVDIINTSQNPVELAKTILREQLNNESFDLLVSIEVCEHMPMDRHDGVAVFFATLARDGTKLIFGAAHPGQGGTGHIGNRSQREWEKILQKVGFKKDPVETLKVAHELDEFNHKVNTQVYYFHPEQEI